jgi:hypothetical protein
MQRTQLKNIQNLFIASIVLELKRVQIPFFYLRYESLLSFCIKFLQKSTYSPYEERKKLEKVLSAEELLCYLQNFLLIFKIDAEMPNFAHLFFKYFANNRVSSYINVSK